MRSRGLGLRVNPAPGGHEKYLQFTGDCIKITVRSWGFFLGCIGHCNLLQVILLWKIPTPRLPPPKPQKKLHSLVASVSSTDPGCHPIMGSSPLLLYGDPADSLGQSLFVTGVAAASGYQRNASSPYVALCCPFVLSASVFSSELGIGLGLNYPQIALIMGGQPGGVVLGGSWYLSTNYSCTYNPCISPLSAPSYKYTYKYSYN